MRGYNQDEEYKNGHKKMMFKKQQRNKDRQWKQMQKEIEGYSRKISLERIEDV